MFETRTFVKWAQRRFAKVTGRPLIINLPGLHQRPAPPLPSLTDLLRAMRGSVPHPGETTHYGRDATDDELSEEARSARAHALRRGVLPFYAR